MYFLLSFDKNSKSESLLFKANKCMPSKTRKIGIIIVCLAKIKIIKAIKVTMGPTNTLLIS